LPEYFRADGYSTHLFGKWHLGFCKDEYLPANRGFDTFQGFMNGQIDNYSHKVGAHVDYFYNSSLYSSFKNCQYDFTEEAIKTARLSQNSKPFFTFLSYSTPHLPLQSRVIFSLANGKNENNPSHSEVKSM
jgi:arylsulfatase A-like enzyme